MELKPGWKDSSFWLAMIGNAPLVACTIAGHESWPCLAAGVISTLSYHWSRGTLKAKALEVAKSLSEK